MEYNRNLGRLMMRKYLARDALQKKLEHSEGVGELALAGLDSVKNF